MSESPESVASGGCFSKPLRLTKLRWWLFVALIVIFLVAGQTAAVLLSRFYFKQGGKSTFMATLVQSSGFPILFIPLLLFPFPEHTTTTTNTRSSDDEIAPPKSRTISIYIALGILTSIDNFLFSVGRLHLPPSTYSIITTTQLLFTATFSYFLNSQKLPPLIINSIAIVTLSSALTAVNRSETLTLTAIGCMATLAATALYSLLLSLTQSAFRRALRRRTFYVVVEMQIWVSVVASAVSIAGLFVSGQWGEIDGEMVGFESGDNSYVMTLVWAAVCWQFGGIGVVGLCFLVSSLFSNVVGAAALAVAPVVAIGVFGDGVSGGKIVALFQAFWGLGSYGYQLYLDERAREEPEEEIGFGA